MHVKEAAIQKCLSLKVFLKTQLIEKKISFLLCFLLLFNY